MASDRLFLDTAFIQALLNPRDDNHSKANALFPRVRAAAEIWLTEAILVEVGNALSAFNRQGAAQFIRQCYTTPNIHVVAVDSPLLSHSHEFVCFGEINRSTCPRFEGRRCHRP